RQRDVFVRAMRERLVDEQVPRRAQHRLEHAQVADALFAKALHHALARALRGHADALDLLRIHFTASRSNCAAIAWNSVLADCSAGWLHMSACSGVIDT